MTNFDFIKTMRGFNMPTRSMQASPGRNAPGEGDRRGRVGVTDGELPDAPRLGGAPGWPGLFHHPRSLTGLTAPRREMERKRRGEARP